MTEGLRETGYGIGSSPRWEKYLDALGVCLNELDDISGYDEATQGQISEAAAKLWEEFREASDTSSDDQ